MNIKQEIEKYVDENDQIYLNDIDIDPKLIKAIMINEVVPADPNNDFYGLEDVAYMGANRFPTSIE